MNPRTTMQIVPALVLGLFAGQASASGFQLLEQNASGIGTAYAGSAAVADNASTVFYNPAGMTQLQDREISVGVSAVTPSFKFANGSSNAVVAGDGGDGGSTRFIPNAYLSAALTKDLYFGLGISSPFGLKTEYDNPWKGGAQSQKFEIRTVNVNPSLAWRVNDKVSLGFGLNWQKFDAEYQRLASTTDLSPVRLNLDDEAWGWNAGVLFTLSPSTKLGLAYRSAVKFETTGDINGSTAAKADLKLPDTFTISVAQKLSDRWEMLGDLSRTGWSSMHKVDIFNGTSLTQTLDTDFRNTWRVALGANYLLNDAWKLKFGIAYDQTPVKGADTRLVSLPDNNRVWLSLGAQWKLSTSSRIDFGGAYLYLKDADINNDQTAAGRGLVNGTYKDSIWVFGAQYSQSF
ncbi:OmpP1/FadL family transporter [Rhodocyclus purpureus]|uniref:OmpP1/FadL family transporter n=1 Tax=Rhodocyclus purpureus TaxID=1067 RepID=UPI00191158DF|nr:OmpP1/FadL family transporter [Rhodocyclus purpureus]MBK5915246.1 long-chain fatty acid transporter [Rhodocyclus purpureus]